MKQAHDWPNTFTVDQLSAEVRKVVGAVVGAAEASVRELEQIK